MSPERLVRISRALGLGDDPGVVLEQLHALYAELDRDLQARSIGLELPCRAGCDACCHEAVFLSAPELLAVLAELLATRSPEELRRITGEMSALASRFADELELLETIPAGEERDEVAARVKFRCPLLGEGGECTVYRARELNARSFGLSWDPQRGAAYGCGLTHERLRVLPEGCGPALVDARAARRQLAERLPATGLVHVFPWWFERLRRELAGDDQEQPLVAPQFGQA